MKRYGLIIPLLCAALLCSACGSAEARAEEPAAAAEMLAADSAETVSLIETQGLISNRDEDASFAEDGILISFGDKIECSASDAVSVDDYSVTISKEGTYILKGAYKNGTVIIDAPKTDKLQLVLDGLEIYSADFAAIYVKQADKVFITLNPGTENSLSNGGEFRADDSSKVDAVIFSKEDLTVNGSGSLNIKSPAGNGISCKDELVFTDGSISVQAGKHAIEAKDSLAVSGGSFTLSSGKDGLHCEHNSDETKGLVYISGGSFTVNAEGDGVSAGAALQLDGGSLDITAGGGRSTVSSSASGFKWNKAPTASSENTVSAKGLKASGSIAVNGGSITINSADDALHAGENVSVSGGSLTLASGDDAIHADEACYILGGAIEISGSYEGLEGSSIEISGGTVSICADDDGINASGGMDSSGFGGFGGFGGNGRFEGGSDSCISISGGIIFVNAAGDGIDSNGSLSISGGELYVAGPSDSANGALDYNVTGDISGGRVIALGAAGMAQNFSSAQQGTMLISTGAQEAGSVLTLTDSKGAVIISYESVKGYSSALISCPEIVQGESYTLKAGSFEMQITMDSLVYTSAGMSGMGIGPNGQHGGKGDFRGAQGDMPQLPDGTEPQRPEGDMPQRPEGDDAQMPGGGRGMRF